MSSFVYDKALEHFGKGEIDWLTADIKCVAVHSADYTPAQAADEFLSAIAAAGRIATSGNMTTKTMVLGGADCDDFTFTAVSGHQINYLVWYKDTGDPATSLLICLVDDYPGLPITPTGVDVRILIPNSANRLFKL